ncbi:hypothetical protein GALMADRAFT_1130971 [Galerina marginata CBS 339.88]|uniref:F-box domain-containing protein n=1 Tax=Galerina marginata (strain CBS 339.88) TaxID=685588 RepID=A0A067SHI5_GALM3|nr:hypothetical protein GALMADRAFT_1130971 [Galerina marginata CBS 339.88]
MPQPSTSTSIVQQPKHFEAVPVELWMKIFELTTSNGADAILPHRSRAPMSISHTCVLWRVIATESSSLWTIISAKTYPLLQVGRKSEVGISPRLPLTDLWLKRSRNLPISIDLAGTWDYRNNKKVKQYFRRLAVDFSRWKSASLDLRNFGSECRAELERHATGASMLEDLKIDLGLDYRPSILRSVPSVIWRNAPRLRTFSIRITWAHEGMTDDLLNWATAAHIPYRQLTYLQLDLSHIEEQTISATQIISIFRQSLDLVSCYITSISHVWNWEPVSPPILLNSLRHLHLSTSQLDFDQGDTLPLAWLLNCLTTTSLVALTVAYDLCWDREQFSSFITRSSCSLENLSLYATPLDPDEFIDCLRINPSLTQLHRSQLPDRPSYINLEVVQAMTAWDTQKAGFSLCPNLQELSFDYFLELSRAERDFLGQLLQERLHPPSRSSPFTTLQVVEYDEDQGVGYEVVLSEFDWLCQPPLNLTINQAKEFHEPWRVGDGL